MARKNRWGGEWANLKEQKIRFRSFARAIDGHGRDKIGGAGSTVFQRIRHGITESYRLAANLIRDKARSGAQSGNAPKRLYTGSRPAIFAFSDANATADSKRSRSSMVGVRTGLAVRTKDPRLFIQWGIGSKRRKDGSVAAKGLAMSLGALFERGTKDRRIRPIRYFRSAIFATRSQVLRMLAAAYKTAADKFNQ